MSHKTEFIVPDTQRPTRTRSPAASKRIAVAASRRLSVLERKKMFEQDRGGGKGGEKDYLLPLDHPDHPGEKTAGKRRHSTKVSRGSSFRSKKLRQEVTTGDLGTNATHGSPQSRHKQSASVTSIVVPPLWNRLRSFGHHDLQSASLERFGSGKGGARGDKPTRKKPTGASAAHVGVTPQEAGVETLENGLVALCPAFRNEIGGDADWAGTSDTANPLLSLRKSLSHDKQKRVCSRAKMLLEGSIPSKEIMEQKSPMDRQVLQILQPQSSIQFPFEYIDYGALFYRNHFYQQGTCVYRSINATGLNSVCEEVHVYTQCMMVCGQIPSLTPHPSPPHSSPSTLPHSPAK